MTVRTRMLDREVVRTRSGRGGIGDRVRQIIDREHDGNVAEAARYLRISQRGLQKVYTGVTKSPRPEVLVRISDVYNVELGWLLTGMERSTPDAIERQATRKALQIVRQMTDSLVANAAKTQTGAPRIRIRPKSSIVPFGDRAPTRNEAR